MALSRRVPTNLSLRSIALRALNLKRESARILFQLPTPCRATPCSRSSVSCSVHFRRGLTERFCSGAPAGASRADVSSEILGSAATKTSASTGASSYEAKLAMEGTCGAKYSCGFSISSTGSDGIRARPGLLSAGRGRGAKMSTDEPASSSLWRFFAAEADARSWPASKGALSASPQWPSALAP